MKTWLGDSVCCWEGDSLIVQQRDPLEAGSFI